MSPRNLARILGVRGMARLALGRLRRQRPQASLAEAVTDA
jgi:hypothetical protein